VTSEKTSHLKEKAKEELRLLVVIWLYLTAVFVSFLTYRRLVSREFGVTSFHYGFALIEALIVAKVILIGKGLGVSRKATGVALGWAVLRASVAYALLVAVFTVIEHVVEALIHGKGVRGGIDEILGNGKYEILGRTLILFVALIPFFAFWELGRQLGEKSVFALLFRKREEPGRVH
jgi:hypothetical protein